MAERDEGLAHRIAVEHGMVGATMTSLAGTGLVNHVFRATAADRSWVVRFALDPREANEYDVEAWAMSAARGAGMPVDEVVAHGVLDSVPYLVQEYVAPEGALADPWTTLGGFARDIAGIPIGKDAPDALFSRFGRDLRAAWQEHIAYNLAALDADPLVAAGVYHPDLLPRIQDDLAFLAGFPFDFGLAHGDLAPRNLIPQAHGRAVLIDWENASTGPTPWTDCLRVFEWAVAAEDGDLEAFARFVAAAGLEVDAAAPIVERMLVLQLLDVTRWAADRRPDLFEKHRNAAAEGIAASYRRR